MVILVDTGPAGCLSIEELYLLTLFTPMPLGRMAIAALFFLRRFGRSPVAGIWELIPTAHLVTSCQHQRKRSDSVTLSCSNPRETAIANQGLMMSVPASVPKKT